MYVCLSYGENYSAHATGTETAYMNPDGAGAQDKQVSHLVSHETRPSAGHSWTPSLAYAYYTLIVLTRILVPLLSLPSAI